jgi:energy-converting hydrogenase Eha subunit E
VKGNDMRNKKYDLQRIKTFAWELIKLILVNITSIFIGLVVMFIFWLPTELLSHSGHLKSYENILSKFVQGFKDNLALYNIVQILVMSIGVITVFAIYNKLLTTFFISKQSETIPFKYYTSVTLGLAVLSSVFLPADSADALSTFLSITAFSLIFFGKRIFESLVEMKKQQAEISEKANQKQRADSSQKTEKQQAEPLEEAPVRAMHHKAPLRYRGHR